MEYIISIWFFVHPIIWQAPISVQSFIFVNRPFSVFKTDTDRFNSLPFPKTDQPLFTLKLFYYYDRREFLFTFNTENFNFKIF